MAQQEFRIRQYGVQSGDEIRETVLHFDDRDAALKYARSTVSVEPLDNPDRRVFGDAPIISGTLGRVDAFSLLKEALRLVREVDLRMLQDTLNVDSSYKQLHERARRIHGVRLELASVVELMK